MSYIDLLFPREELEALGNNWPEPANKRRKLDLNAGLARGKQQKQQEQQPNTRVKTGTSANQRRHTLSVASQSRKATSSSGTVPSMIKRSNSDVKLPTSSIPPSATSKLAATPKSFLPSFIEPSILKNYLQHLHPNDRSRYSIPNSPEPEARPQRQEAPGRTMMHQEHEDESCSPASLITDNSSSTADNQDSCPTPGPGIYEQLRDSRFGYLIHGLRLTDHEKDLVEDLLSPSQVDNMPPPPARSASTTNMKRKSEGLEMGFSLENSLEFNQRLLQRMFPPDCENTISEFSYFNNMNNARRDSDVHSSGLSPGPQMEDEEEDVKQEELEKDDMPTMSTRGFAISVNDFFDLDEASGYTELNDDDE